MRPLTKRPDRLAIVFGVVASLVLVACGSSSSKAASNTGGTTTSPAAATVASKLTLGGAPECLQRPFCLPGLQKTYGVMFKEFKPLDAAGPLTYAAITSGAIDVAEVFSTDGLIADKGLVVLQDDRHLQNADNVVPVIRTVKVTPGVTSVVNSVSAALTTDALTQLNKKVTVDKADVSTVASQFLKDKGLDAKSTSAQGVALKVGSFNFSESALLAQIYGQALRAAGANVTIQTNLGSRETLEPGLASGKLDLLPEYAATALEFLNKGAKEASGDVNATVAALSVHELANGVSVLKPSPAVDTNAFAVTKATADKYHLANLSDLANPSP